MATMQNAPMLLKITTKIFGVQSFICAYGSGGGGGIVAGGGDVGLG